MSDADRLLEGKITMSQRVISQKTYVQKNVLRSALWRAALGSAPDPKGGKCEFLLIELLQRTLCLLVEDMIHTGNY